MTSVTLFDIKPGQDSSRYWFIVKSSAASAAYAEMGAYHLIIWTIHMQDKLTADIQQAFS